MRTCISKLLEIASQPLCAPPPVRPDLGGARGELEELYRDRNGFYAFESALHVFPSATSLCSHITSERWNEAATWKAPYDAITDDLWCFAEDVFGEQFAIRGEAVVSLNPESGEITPLSATLEEWACRVLTEYEVLTGFTLAHAWQDEFGPLSVGKRLVPKVPFIFGGEYAVENLHALDAVKGMHLRGEIYKQIRDLPDGARLRLGVRKRGL